MEENINRINNEEKNNFVLEDIIKLFLSKWHWFVISLVCCLFVAVAYVMVTTPIYTRSMSLLIKDDTKSKGIGGAAQGFEDLGLFKSNININNEMLSITAPVMMQDVVKRLKLDVSMTVKNGFKKHILYSDAPVSVTFSGVSDDDFFSFVIEMANDGTIKMNDFFILGKKYSNVITGRIGTNIKTPYGIVRFDKTPAFSEDFVGVPITVNKYNVKAIASAFSGSLSVNLSEKESTIINLTFTDPIIRRADDILNTLVEIYNEKWVEDKNLVAIATAKFIDERLDSIFRELGSVDDKIADFKSSNLMPDVTAVSSMYLSQSTKNNDQILELNNQLSMVKYVRNYLTDATKTLQVLPMNSGIGSSGVESQIQEYNSNLMLRNNLFANSSDKNPLVVDKDRQLASMRSAIVRSLDNLVVQLNTQISNYRANESVTNNQIASSPRQAKKLLSVERTQQVKQSLYIYLLQKREENAMSKAYVSYNSRVIQPPFGGNSPTAPKNSVIFLAAFALGLVIPGALLILLENMNTSVRGSRDIQDISIPYIGDIPFIGKEKGRIRTFLSRNKKRKRVEVVVKEKGRDLANESFRIVRTKLEYVLNLNSNKDDHKSIMITSFNPGSGKTFISINLCQSYGIQNKKVVLLDLDLRRARSSCDLGFSHCKDGSSTYLSGFTDDINDIVIENVGGNMFDLVPVGVIPPNPTELLLKEGRLEKLIADLKVKYDYVFVDCPPFDIVADASIIAPFVNNTIFVIRVDVMDRRLLPDVERLYEDKNLNGMSILLNCGKFVNSKYGYRRYSYRYGYSYGGYYKKDNE